TDVAPRRIAAPRAVGADEDVICPGSALIGLDTDVGTAIRVGVEPEAKEIITRERSSIELEEEGHEQLVPQEGARQRALCNRVGVTRDAQGVRAAKIHRRIDYFGPGRRSGPGASPARATVPGIEFAQGVVEIVAR